MNLGVKHELHLDNALTAVNPLFITNEPECSENKLLDTFAGQDSSDKVHVPKKRTSVRRSVQSIRENIGPLVFNNTTPNICLPDPDLDNIEEIHALVTQLARLGNIPPPPPLPEIQTDPLKDEDKASKYSEMSSEDLLKTILRNLSRVKGSTRHRAPNTKPFSTVVSILKQLKGRREDEARASRRARGFLTEAEKIQQFQKQTKFDLISHGWADPDRMKGCMILEKIVTDEEPPARPSPADNKRRERERKLRSKAVLNAVKADHEFMEYVDRTTKPLFETVFYTKSLESRRRIASSLAVINDPRFATEYRAQYDVRNVYSCRQEPL